MSRDGGRQTECEKRRERREEQCLSNTEWVASHICPCRVCKGERGRGRRSGHSLFSPVGPCPLRFTEEMFPKSHLSVFIQLLLKHMLTQALHRICSEWATTQRYSSLSLQICAAERGQSCLVTVDKWLLSEWAGSTNEWPLGLGGAAKLPFASFLILLSPPWKEVSSWMESGGLRGRREKKLVSGVLF